MSITLTYKYLSVLGKVYFSWNDDIIYMPCPLLHILWNSFRSIYFRFSCKSGHPRLIMLDELSVNSLFEQTNRAAHF